MFKIGALLHAKQGSGLVEVRTLIPTTDMDHTLPRPPALVESGRLLHHLHRLCCLLQGYNSVEELVEKADGFAEVFPEHKYEIVKM